MNNHRPAFSPRTPCLCCHPRRCGYRPRSDGPTPRPVSVRRVVPSHRLGHRAATARSAAPACWGNRFVQLRRLRHSNDATIRTAVLHRPQDGRSPYSPPQPQNDAVLKRARKTSSICFNVTNREKGRETAPCLLYGTEVSGPASKPISFPTSCADKRSRLSSNSSVCPSCGSFRRTLRQS